MLSIFGLLFLFFFLIVVESVYNSSICLGNLLNTNKRLSHRPISGDASFRASSLFSFWAFGVSSFDVYVLGSFVEKFCSDAQKVR